MRPPESEAAEWRASASIFTTPPCATAPRPRASILGPDKAAIAHALDRFGIDYIEGGWPGANPTDDAFFAKPPELARARLAAFGMTRRAGRSAANDPGLAALSGAAPRSCLVGKTWDFQVATSRSASISTRTCA